MGLIQYTTITDKKCCGGKSVTYQIPIGSTPHEIATITGMSLEQAIELAATSVQDSDKCDTPIFYNVEISQLVKKECLNGNGTEVNVTVPAGMFSSQLSQEDADQKAQDYFDEIAQDIANDLGECPEAGCIGCGDYRIVNSKPCGEFRRDTQCRDGNCVDIGPEYFVCTGDCDGEQCAQDCGNCSVVCPTGSCPPGFVCVSGLCKPDCDGAECSTVCRDNPCFDPCEECVRGECTPIICPEGQQCVNGVCTDLPCIPPCTYRVVVTEECKETRQAQKCNRGTCVDDTSLPPYDIILNDGKPCQDGICKQGDCVQNPTACDPPCQNSPFEDVPERPCLQKRDIIECIDGKCVKVAEETIKKPDGDKCPGGTCLDGNCLQDCLNEGGSTCPETQCCEGLECIERVCQEPRCDEVNTKTFSNTPLTVVNLGVAEFKIVRTDGGNFVNDFSGQILPPEPMTIKICTDMGVNVSRIVSSNLNTITPTELYFSGSQQMPSAAFSQPVTLFFEIEIPPVPPAVLINTVNHKYGSEECCVSYFFSSDIGIKPPPGL